MIARRVLSGLVVGFTLSPSAALALSVDPPRAEVRPGFTMAGTVGLGGAATTGNQSVGLFGSLRPGYRIGQAWTLELNLHGSWGPSETQPTGGDAGTLLAASAAPLALYRVGGWMTEAYVGIGAGGAYIRRTLEDGPLSRSFDSFGVSIPVVFEYDIRTPWPIDPLFELTIAFLGFEEGGVIDFGFGLGARW